MRRSVLCAGVSLALLLAGAAAANAQDAAAPAPATPAAPAAEAAPPPAESGGLLEYQRGTFRDPFRSLEEPKPDAMRPRPPGPAGMLIEEVDVIGILSGPKGSMILIIGTDGLGYSLTEGTELYDGKVLTIDERDGRVVFRQNVNDPNLIKPYRDIERRLETAS
jgi:hypothetical protein